MAFMLFCLLFLMGSVVDSYAQSSVYGVRLGASADKTRIVFDISGAVEEKVYTLKDPNRLVVDLESAHWRVTEDVSTAVSGNLVKKIDHSVLKMGVQRVVFFLTAPVEITRKFTLAGSGDKPPRLVIDIVPQKGGGIVSAKKVKRGEMASGASTPAPSSSGEQVGEQVYAPIPTQRPYTYQRKDKYTVVIDAGHGGRDPGAVSPIGLYEKTVTFNAAKELRDALEATGRYKVVLTRERDVYLKLRTRINKARAANADLFISLHADAHPKSSVRGASVYTLSEVASDREAARLARQENKADLIGGVDLSEKDADVTSILLDLAQRETMNYSAKYAQMLVDGLDKRVTLLRRTHRFAGFVVLKSPDVPSILLEMGYLTNRRDAQLLKTKAYRAKIIDGVVETTNGFFDWRESLQRQ